MTIALNCKVDTASTEKRQQSHTTNAILGFLRRAYCTPILRATAHLLSIGMIQVLRLGADWIRLHAALDIHGQLFCRRSSIGFGMTIFAGALEALVAPLLNRLRKSLPVEVGMTAASWRRAK